MIRSLLMVVALAVALSACGRKGAPDQPEGSTFPNDYPYTPLPAETKTKPGTTTNTGY
jgi:predicted small lipoprotein YifL